MHDMEHVKTTFYSKIWMHVSCNDTAFRFSLHTNKIVKILRHKFLAKLLGGVSGA